MPPLHRGRPLKRWRYVGVFGPELMLCVGEARVGVLPRRWWALAEPIGTLYGADGAGALRLHLAGEAIHEGLDLVLHELLERALLPQGVVDREPDPLVVAAGTKPADRLDDLHVARGVPAAVRTQHLELGQAVEDVLRNVVVRRSSATDARTRSPWSARSRIRSSSSTSARAHSGSRRACP
jgi:hypothetical protein